MLNSDTEFTLRRNSSVNTVWFENCPSIHYLKEPPVRGVHLAHVCGIFGLRCSRHRECRPPPKSWRSLRFVFSRSEWRLNDNTIHLPGHIFEPETLTGRVHRPSLSVFLQATWSPSLQPFARYSSIADCLSSPEGRLAVQYFIEPSGSFIPAGL